MFRRIMLGALLAGVIALLVVPFLVPVDSSGTLTEREAAGANAEFLSIGDLELHVETAAYRGDAPNPPVIVLLHGFGASTFSWREVIEPLAELGDVIAYDRAGFGFTERPDDWASENPYGLPGNTALLGALLDEVAADREVVLVGHSAGGLVAAEFARLQPERVDRLVLVAPAILGGGGPPGWITPLLRIPQIDRLGPVAVQGIASSGDQILADSFADPAAVTADVREGYRAPLTVIGWERALWRVTTAPRDTDLADSLAELTVPTLVVTGDADTIVATADSERIAGLLPDADLVVIPRSGHLPHEETAAAFLNAVVGWLAP